MIFEPVNYDDLVFFLSDSKFDEPTQDYINKFGIETVARNVLNSHFDFMEKYGVGSVFLVKDEDTKFIIGLAGASNVLFGNVEWYSFADQSMSAYVFAKSMMWYFDYLLSIKDIYRVQSTVLEDNKKAYNLHQKLGFITEGVLRKYDGKNNYYIMAYIR